MASDNIDELTNALESTRVSPAGVSFAGKVLKPNTEEDAKPITDEIDKCTNLEYLNLEGNSLGVDAAKAIGKSLGKHPEFKRALWKDMFTGRMKEEIPLALQHLGNGLVLAGALLTELDLSDNAFGPIGMRTLANFIKSPSCYALEELRLNNNGLGITGGKMLAGALTEGYNTSKTAGKPLALRVFIAGRNRLENDGAVALAAVFKLMGTLEEVAMPQNGIYHVGIAALSEAFTHNPNLRIINLNDNTVTAKGAEAFAKALPHLQSLREINFGDCLLKTKGAMLLAQALQGGHSDLEELILGQNEIRTDGGVQIAKVLANKSKLKNLNLNGNIFGEEGIDAIKKELRTIGKLNVLDTLSEDEFDSDDETEGEDEAAAESSNHSEEGSDAEADEQIVETKTVQEFFDSPTPENFMALGDSRIDLILGAAKEKGEISLDPFLSVLMKVSSLCRNNKENIAQLSLQCSERLYSELFTWSQKKDNGSEVRNSLLVHLGLIKGEDKTFKPKWNLESCRHALESVLEKPFLDQSSKDTLKLFLQTQANGKR